MTEKATYTDLYNMTYAIASSVPESYRDEVISEMLLCFGKLEGTPKVFAFVSLKNKKIDAIRSVRITKVNGNLVYNVDDEEYEEEEDSSFIDVRKLSALAFAYDRVGSSGKRLIRTAVVNSCNSHELSITGCIRDCGMTKRRGMTVLKIIRSKMALYKGEYDELYGLHSFEDLCERIQGGEFCGCSFCPRLSKRWFG